MASLILYVTEHCSLCDSAFDLVLGMPELAGTSLSVLDIATPGAVSAQEFDLLGPRLPVLALHTQDPAGPKQRLYWPFTAQQVVQLVAPQPAA